MKQQQTFRESFPSEHETRQLLLWTQVRQSRDGSQEEDSQSKNKSRYKWFNATRSAALQRKQSQLNASKLWGCTDISCGTTPGRQKVKAENVLIFFAVKW